MSPSPPNLIDLHKYVTLVGDVMFVNGIPFLVTMSRRIRFITVQHVPDRKASALANVMKQVMNLYSRAGFVCQTALMDGEFEPLKAKLVGSIEVNTTAKNEHVGEIERKICSLKDNGIGSSDAFCCVAQHCHQSHGHQCRDADECSY